MKKFSLKLFLFIGICISVIGAYNHLASVSIEKFHGPSTEDQISMSFSNAIQNDYNCYILGNSRIYRGVNPDLFTKVRSFNFAHDNDSYNQMYYKLLYLLENNKNIEYLIIGTDYFQFSFLADSRNYIYDRFFPKEYLYDYEMHSFLDIIVSHYSSLWINKQNALPSCIKYVLGISEPEQKKHLKDNGQYITYGEANPNATTNVDYSVKDIQYDYFIKIINVCENENIELFVIMPPLWEGETKSHSDQERELFNAMIYDSLSKTDYRNNYINYSKEVGLSSYVDFVDITHLNQTAADAFSEYINNRIFRE